MHPKKNITDDFRQKVDEKEQRMLKAQKEKKRSAWLGLSVFGIVGWSVAVPTIIGAIIGQHLDKTHPTSFSWTLALLIAGLMIGCIMAWEWISKEHKEMHQTTKEDGHE